MNCYVTQTKSAHLLCIGLLLACFMAMLPAQAQVMFSDTLQIRNKITQQAPAFVTDPMLNTYWIQRQSIVKTDPTNVKLFDFASLQNGDIHAVDASNPLRLLLFYRDFQRIDLLDNTLSKATPTLDLSRLIATNIALAALAFDNNMWLYNSINKELLLVNDKLEIVQRSGNISQWCQLDSLPERLQATSKGLYLHVKNKGILQFDIFGNYLSLYPNIHIRQFKVMDDALYYLEENKLVKRIPETGIEYQYTFKETHILSFDIQAKGLTVLTDQGLITYAKP